MSDIARPTEFVKTLIARGIIPGPLDDIRRVEIIADAKDSAVCLVVHRIGGRAIVKMFADATTAASEEWTP